MFSLSAKDIRRRIVEEDFDEFNVVEVPPLQQFTKDLEKEMKGLAMKIIHTQMSENVDGIFSHRCFYKYDTLRYGYLSDVLALLKNEDLSFGDYLGALVRANFSGFDIKMEMEPTCYRFEFYWSSKSEPTPPPSHPPASETSQSSSG
jgi:hypothetical protein